MQTCIDAHAPCMYFAYSISGLPACVSICVHICENYNITTAVSASTPEETAHHNTIIRSKKLVPLYFPINTGGEFHMEPVPINIPFEPHTAPLSILCVLRHEFIPFSDTHRTPKYATIFLKISSCFVLLAHTQAYDYFHKTFLIFFLYL